MNDLLIANTHQYAPSKYHLRRGTQQTHQQSSGLLFSTWFGQGAWLRNAMSSEDFEQLKAQASAIRDSQHYFVYARDLSPEQRTHEWAWKDWTDEETTITSDMHRGYVVPDVMGRGSFQSRSDHHGECRSSETNVAYLQNDD